jgi:2-(1,2-epoxy-1,2-dihydrophenyl)acetyl-CoA isomerase
MDYDFILYERIGAVGKITLNRPEQLNAFNTQTGIELLDALEQCEYDQEVRCVILTGAGRSFCAGDDLKGMTTSKVGNYREGTDSTKYYAFGKGRWTVVVYAMRRLPKPIVGSIRGHAWGAGVNLALGCDMRVCSETASFCTPFIRWGLATGTNLLPYFVNMGIAMEMAMLGQPIDAQRALQLGMANRVVPDAQLEEATMQFATQLAEGPTRALGLTKAAMYKGWWRDPEVAFDYQGYAQSSARITEDDAEGRAAFREKRKPRFKGR